MKILAAWDRGDDRHVEWGLLDVMLRERLGRELIHRFCEIYINADRWIAPHTTAPNAKEQGRNSIVRQVDGMYPVLANLEADS